MLSPEMYLDASLVKANVSGYGLQPSGITVAEFTVAEFKEQAIEENGLFVLTTTTLDDNGVEQGELVLSRNVDVTRYRHGSRKPATCCIRGRREPDMFPTAP